MSGYSIPEGLRETGHPSGLRALALAEVDTGGALHSVAVRADAEPGAETCEGFRVEVDGEVARRADSPEEARLAFKAEIGGFRHERGGKPEVVPHADHLDEIGEAAPKPGM